MTHLAEDLIKQKQLAFRRANTDLNAELVHYLIQNKTDSNNNSSKPSLNLNLQLRRPALDAQQQAIAYQNRRHKIHQKLEPSKFPNPVKMPMVPPKGRTHQEEDQAIKRCINELKNKR